MGVNMVDVIRPITKSGVRPTDPTVRCIGLAMTVEQRCRRRSESLSGSLVNDVVITIIIIIVIR